MKKVILPGLLAGVVMLTAGMLFSRALGFAVPEVENEYQNPQLFRPWSDPLMMLYFLHPIAMGLVLAWVWNMVKQLFTGNGYFENGIKFGLVFWVTTLPGMLISYSTFPVSLAMIFSWTASGFLELIIGGLIICRMNK